jgi:hypothetical protein
MMLESEIQGKYFVFEAVTHFYEIIFQNKASIGNDVLFSLFFIGFYVL